MLHCPLSFNHVFHRNLFPRSQRGELREKRCGLLPNRANFISFSGAPARRNGWTDFLRRKKLGIAEKGRREERGKMARDTGGIIVNFENERHAPSSTPAIFLETNSKESFQPRVGCTRGGNRSSILQKKKTPSTSSTTVDPQPTSNIRELDLLRAAGSYDFVPGSSSPRFPRGELASLARPFLFKGTAYTSVETSGIAKSNRLHEEAEVEGCGESGCLVSAEQHRPTSK